jgi:hypothetical protein
MASIPLQRGVEGGDLIQILAFSVILFSTLLSTAFIVVVEHGAFSSFSQWLFKGFSEENNG